MHRHGMSRALDIYKVHALDLGSCQLPRDSVVILLHSQVDCRHFKETYTHVPERQWLIATTWSGRPISDDYRPAVLLRMHADIKTLL